MTGLLLAAAVAIAGEDDGGTLSPLHSYLGIDAESGEFADKPAATRWSGTRSTARSSATRPAPSGSRSAIRSAPPR